MNLLAGHEDHALEEIGLCVYCRTCDGLRLYQGSIPKSHPSYPLNRDSCTHEDMDDQIGLGFYAICRDCGFREWFK